MAKLLFLQGLPASGKSTLAKTLVAEGWVDVNKDEIRVELAKTGWTWSPEKEQDVLKIQGQQIKAALGGGKDVVSSDTNFGRKHEDRLRAIAKELKADFEIKVLDTPVEECVKRDAERAARGGPSVGSKVIWEMYYKYVKPQDVVVNIIFTLL